MVHLDANTFKTALFKNCDESEHNESEDEDEDGPIVDSVRGNVVQKSNVSVKCVT